MPTPLLSTSTKSQRDFPLLSDKNGWLAVAYFTKKVNPSLAKPPWNGGLAKLELTSLVKWATVLLNNWGNALCNMNYSYIKALYNIN